MMADRVTYGVFGEPLVKLLSGDGRQLGKRVQGFPLASELTSSGLLVVLVDNRNNAVAACGIRSRFNVLVLYVEESYRGRGLGTEVLVKTIDAARKHGLNFVTLSVSSDNVAAYRIYSTEGFKELVYLRKPDLILMINPLNRKGWFVYEFLKSLCALLPNSFLTSVHGWLYERTV
jgi:ribosomal protein S18 acetylase RimI-like enzyme